MSLLYPFTPKLKKDLLELVVAEFNSQRGTSHTASGFELLMTKPFRKGDKIGLLAVTKNQGDFLRLRLRLSSLDLYNGFTPFLLEHDKNHASSLWEIFWESSMVLKKEDFQELTTAQNSALYQGYLNSDHILRLEGGGRLASGFGSFIKLEQ